MSSLAMIMATKGHSFTPATLNNWLVSHHGYESGDLLVWSAVDSLGKVHFQGIENPSMKTVINGVNAVGTPYSPRTRM